MWAQTALEASIKSVSGVSHLMRREHQRTFLEALTAIEKHLCGDTTGTEIGGLAKYLLSVVECGTLDAPATTGFGLIFLLYLVRALVGHRGNSGRNDFSTWAVPRELQELMALLSKKTDLWWSSGLRWPRRGG